jgi:hypothetical protein
MSLSPSVVNLWQGKIRDRSLQADDDMTGSIIASRGLAREPPTSFRREAAPLAFRAIEHEPNQIALVLFGFVERKGIAMSMAREWCRRVPGALESMT